MHVVVLVDTNVWVSALINPHGYAAKIKDAWIAGKFQVVVSPALLDELAEVLARPRISNKYKLNDHIINNYISLLETEAVHVNTTGTFQICRDPDNDIILETAIAGKATIAVSRDDDLKRDQDLILHMEHHGVSVMSIQQFLNWMETHC